MAVDGGNANGEAHVAHAAAGDGPNVDRYTDPEMNVSLNLAARSTRTLAQPRRSLESRSLLTRVRTTFASATALARTLGVSLRRVLSVIIAMKEVACQHGPWCGICIP